MKYYWTLIISLIVMQPALAQHRRHIKEQIEQTENKIPELNNAYDSLSYALGLNYAGWMQQQGLDTLNFNVFISAMQASMHGDSVVMDDKTAYNTMQQKFSELKKEEAAKDLEAGEKFLTENKTKPGVITLPDGLEYQVLQEGTGPRPTAEDKVKVNYEGQLINGKVFDSSVKRGEPMVFVVSNVIKGWTEALELMPVGSKWRLYIPPSLGYGAGNIGNIPPNSVLIFDVELLDIVK